MLYKNCIHSIRKEREGDREAVLAALICRTFHDHVMVFVQTKKQAHRLHILLGLLGVKVSKSSIYNSWCNNDLYYFRFLLYSQGWGTSW